MKNKKFLAALAVAAIMGISCVSVLAAADANTTPSTETQTEQPSTSATPDTDSNVKRPAPPSFVKGFGGEPRVERFKDGEMPELTDEEKALFEEKRKEIEEFAAKHEETLEKWAALTEAQKNELYAIEEQSIALEKQKIDKQLELGLIDQETADAAKAELDKVVADMRENDIMPGGKMFRIHGVMDKMGKDEVHFSTKGAAGMTGKFHFSINGETSESSTENQDTTKSDSGQQ